MDIKTSVVQSSIERAHSLPTGDLGLYIVGSDFFKEYIQKQHISKVLNQMFVLLVNYVTYVSASETEILCVLISNGLHEILLNNLVHLGQILILP